jgi:hypothetical protein
MKKSRLVELLLKKKDAGYWEHLLTKEDKARFKNQCKVDFSKWTDEEDEKALDLDESGFAGLGGGAGGMGGAGGADLAAMMQAMGRGGGSGGEP